MLGRGMLMDFTLIELGKKEILSLYRRFLTKFFDGPDADYLISEAAMRWLIAKKICSCYGLYDDKKHLLCFGIFVNDVEKRVMLLDYFVVLKKYRGYNYSEIFFEMLREMFIPESEEEDNTDMPFGIFIELIGVSGISEKNLEKGQREIDFYKGLGAYITDIVPLFSWDEYNVMFLPVKARLSRSELKTEFLNIYKEILPSFKDKKKYITRLTEEVDGLI